MNRFAFVLPVVALLAVAGCASPATSSAPSAAPAPVTAEPTPTATSLPAGKFKLTTLSGAEISFTLPTPATDPKVKEIEAFRKKVGAAPVSYLVADVDNRKGTERVNMYMVSAFDADGRQYSFTSVTDAIDLWKPSYQANDTYLLPTGKVLSGDAGTPLSNEAIDLISAHNDLAEVAERKTFVLASTEATLPAEFTRVSVQPSGGMAEGEDATPAP